jgi:hypothetical protein
MSIKNRTFEVGMLVGISLLGSVCWVYLQTHDLTSGGLAIALFGFILLSLSVWRNIDVSIGQKGITAKFEQFAAEIKAETNAVIDKIEKTESVAAETADAVVKLKRSIDVRNAQAVLAAAGYSAFADGVIGPQTIIAIKAFQSDKGLPVTGELDRETLNAMHLSPMN